MLAGVRRGKLIDIAVGWPVCIGIEVGIECPAVTSQESVRIHSRNDVILIQAQVSSTQRCEPLRYRSMRPQY